MSTDTERIAAQLKEAEAILNEHEKHKGRSLVHGLLFKSSAERVEDLRQQLAEAEHADDVEWSQAASVSSLRNAWELDAIISSALAGHPYEGSANEGLAKRAVQSMEKRSVEDLPRWAKELANSMILGGD